MPKKLAEFLKSLNNKEQEEVWLWLDSNPNAIEEMIMLIALKSHKKGEIK